MVVETLDLGYLSLFLGMRINELVVQRMTRAGFPARESHGYVIQHLIEKERTITELARRMGITQQAASKTVAQMIELGILESVAGEDRRAKRIRLSARGWKGVTLARRERRRIETRLTKKLGAKYSVAQSILTQALQTLGAISQIESRRIRVPD